MQLLTIRQNRDFQTLGLMRSRLLVAGVLGLSLVAAQIGTAPKAHAAPASRHYYQRGYYLDNSWLCYGWTDGAYRCTHYWHRSTDGTLIFGHASWVPNHGETPAMIAAHMPAPVSHAPAHTPPPPPNPGSGSVVGEIQSVFGPYAGAALAIARCESGYNPSAYNASSGASGVFQFLRSTWATTSYAGYSPFNAWANIHAAYQVFSRDGHSWREWQCQP